MLRIFLLILLANFSFADTAAAIDQGVKIRLSLPKILQNLHMNGYDIVMAIELKQDEFVAEAVTLQGKKITVIINAYTGEITQPSNNSALSFSLEDAVKQVEGSGYHDAYSAACVGNKYNIFAYDQNDKKVKLRVDGETGEISSSLFGF